MKKFLIYYSFIIVSLMVFVSFTKINNLTHLITNLFFSSFHLFF